MPNLTRIIGGKERTFPLLSADDLETLTFTIPNPSGEIIDLRGLDRWAKHVKGCDLFIRASAVKADPTITTPQIRTWGSIMDRTNLAADLFAASITASEEPDAPKGQGGEKGTTPPTGS